MVTLAAPYGLSVRCIGGIGGYNVLSRAMKISYLLYDTCTEPLGNGLMHFYRDLLKEWHYVGQRKKLNSPTEEYHHRESEIVPLR